MSRRHEITLTQLRYFATAAERRSMTEAARELFVAQSAVSAAIGQLEQQVGTQLFIRQRSKGLVLTPAGVQLLGDVRALMLGLDQAVDAARGMDNQVRGTIRLACFVTLAPFILPEVISRARAAHPYLDIEVDEVDAEEAREALRSGRAELSVGYDFAYGDGIKREVIDTTPAHVLLPAGHPLAGRDRVFLRDLAREKLILLDLPHSREYFLQLLSSAGLEPEIAHRSRNYETVRAMVAHGHGFSVLNQRPRHDLTYDGRRVAARRIADDVPALRVVIATLPRVRQTARAAALAEVIRAVFRDTASAGTDAAGERAICLSDAVHLDAFASMVAEVSGCAVRFQRFRCPRARVGVRVAAVEIAQRGRLSERGSRGGGTESNLDSPCARACGRVWCICCPLANPPLAFVDRGRRRVDRGGDARDVCLRAGRVADLARSGVSGGCPGGLGRVGAGAGWISFPPIPRCRRSPLSCSPSRWCSPFSPRGWLTGCCARRKRAPRWGHSARPGAGGHVGEGVVIAVEW